MTVSRSGGNRDQMINDGTILNRCCKHFRGGAGFQACIDHASGLRIQNEPGFGFQMGFRMIGDIGVIRMNLHGEVVMGIEIFEQQREATFRRA